MNPILKIPNHKSILKMQVINWNRQLKFNHNILKMQVKEVLYLIIIKFILKIIWSLLHILIPHLKMEQTQFIAPNILKYLKRDKLND